MGLFSSKTVITTGTSISPFLGQKPNIIRDAVIRATINDWPKTPTILDAIISGYNVDPEGYYNYGKDEYALGLPSSTLYSLDIDTNAVTYAARNDYAGWQFLDYNSAVVSDISFGTLDLTYATYKALHSIFNMNAQGTTYNVDGFGMLHANYGLLGKDASVEDVYFDSLGSIDFATRVLTVNLYSVTKDTTDANRQDFSYAIVDTDLTSALGMVKLENQVYKAKVEYTYTGSANPTPYTTFVHYFVYDPQTGTKPDLPYYTGDAQVSPYYPIGLVRRSGEFLTSPTEREDTNNLLKFLAGTELEKLQDALADNPDLDKIDNTFVTLALPIGRDFDVGRRISEGNPYYERDDILLKYLYYYFEHLNAISTVEEADFNDSLLDTNLPPKLNTLRIADSTYRTDLYWNYVKVNQDPFSHPYRSDRNFDLNIKALAGAEYNVGEDNYYSNNFIKVVRYNHATRSVSSYTVWGLFTSSGVYEGKDVITNLYDALREPANENDIVYDGFFLPLHRDSILRLSKHERTYVAFSSTILVNYAVDRQKVKWYQRGAFLTLIRIIAVIVSVYTMNPTVAAGAAAFAYQVAVLILEQVLISLVVAPLLSFALKEIADLIGGEFAAIIAVVVMAIAAAYGANYAYEIPFADTLLKSVTTLSDIALENLREDYVALQEEINVFKSEYRALVNEIEAAMDLLGESGINAAWFNGLNNTLAVESPSGYYSRTLNVDSNTSNDLLNNFYTNHLHLGV